MSDLTYYRDTKQPLVERVRRAAEDHLESTEMDELLRAFARELATIASRARRAAAAANAVLTDGTYDSEDLEWAAGALDDLAAALRGP